MGLLAYGILALAIIGALGGTAWKLDHNGYERGYGAAQKKADDAAAAAKAAAEADMARQEALRQAQDKEATRRLTNEKNRSRTLMASLEAHIHAAGTTATCAIPDSLRDDWNAANAGPQGAGPGAVPSASGKPADPR